MTPHIKEIMKSGRQVLDDMDSYNRMRYDESDMAGITVGVCILLCAVIYLISIWPR